MLPILPGPAVCENEIVLEGEKLLALYVIGDLHLSLGADKPMDVFYGWEDYVQRIEANWKNTIADEDTVVLAGDSSWAMSIENTLEDFRFIHQLPGQKWLLKGNHDYWWSTKSKMEAFLSQNGLTSLHILHNNAVEVDGMAVCGTRGWMFEKGANPDKKIVSREAGRLEASIRDADRFGAVEKVAFLHYPPVYGNDITPAIVDVLLQNNIRRCFYGHIHGAGCRYAIDGVYLGIDFRLISSDYLDFQPVRVEPARLKA